MRLNLTIDDDHAERLTRLAEAAHVQPGTLARSLLLTALDRSAEAAASRDLLEILESIPGAADRVEAGRGELARGEGIPLADL